MSCNEKDLREVRLPRKRPSSILEGLEGSVDPKSEDDNSPFDDEVQAIIGKKEIDVKQEAEQDKSKTERLEINISVGYFTDEEAQKNESIFCKALLLLYPSKITQKRHTIKAPHTIRLHAPEIQIIINLLSFRQAVKRVQENIDYELAKSLRRKSLMIDEIAANKNVVLVFSEDGEQTKVDLMAISDRTDYEMAFVVQSQFKKIFDKYLRGGSPSTLDLGMVGLEVRQKLFKQCYVFIKYCKKNLVDDTEELNNGFFLLEDFEHLANEVVPLIEQEYRDYYSDTERPQMSGLGKTIHHSKSDVVISTHHEDEARFEKKETAEFINLEMTHFDKVRYIFELLVKILDYEPKSSCCKRINITGVKENLTNLEKHLLTVLVDQEIDNIKLSKKILVSFEKHADLVGREKEGQKYKDKMCHILYAAVEYFGKFLSTPTTQLSARHSKVVWR